MARLAVEAAEPGDHLLERGVDAFERALDALVGTVAAAPEVVEIAPEEPDLRLGFRPRQRRERVRDGGLGGPLGRLIGAGAHELDLGHEVAHGAFERRKRRVAGAALEPPRQDRDLLFERVEGIGAGARPLGLVDARDERPQHVLNRLELRRRTSSGQRLVETVEPLDEAVEAFRRGPANGYARLLGEPVELLRQGVDAPGDVARGLRRDLAAEAVELAREPVEAALELPRVELAAADLRQALVQLGELSRELLDPLRLGHVGEEAANVQELLRQAVDDLGVDAAARDRLDAARERLELARQAAMNAARHELGDAADLRLELLDRTAHRREVAGGAGVRDLGRDAAKRALERVDLVAGRKPGDHGLQALDLAAQAGDLGRSAGARPQRVELAREARDVAAQRVQDVRGRARRQRTRRAGRRYIGGVGRLRRAIELGLAGADLGDGAPDLGGPARPGRRALGEPVGDLGDSRLEAAQDGLDRGVGALLGLVVRFRELRLDALDRLQRGFERRTAAVRELALDLVEPGGHRREGVAEHRGRVFLPLGGIARGGGEAVLGALDPARDRAQGGSGLGSLLAAAALGRLGGAGKKALEFLGRDAGGLAGKVRHRLELRDGGVELVRLLRPLALLRLAGLCGSGLGGLVGADGGEPFVERHAGVARRLSGLRIEAVEPEG